MARMTRYGRMLNHAMYDWVRSLEERMDDVSSRSSGDTGLSAADGNDIEGGNIPDWEDDIEDAGDNPDGTPMQSFDLTDSDPTEAEAAATWEIDNVEYDLGDHYDPLADPVWPLQLMDGSADLTDYEGLLFDVPWEADDEDEIDASPLMLQSVEYTGTDPGTGTIDALVPGGQ